MEPSVLVNASTLASNKETRLSGMAKKHAIIEIKETTINEIRYFFIISGNIIITKLFFIVEE